MTYTPHKPPIAESPDELRKRIPGWGVDLDAKDRPSVPKLQFQEDFTGAHWEFPERQPEKYPRERSVEHGMLTPVFGIAQPPSGVAGAIRRYAYTYSEGRTAHWLLLIAADRVDAWEHHLKSFLTLRPDNPITETGVKAEFTHNGLSSRFGQNRADVKHQWLDPVIVGGPWIAAAGIVYSGARSVARSLSLVGSDGHRQVH
ncbi:hypothetical protein [Blastococcus sp. TF02A-35]|uniref:hypothetical protein n=1 Tax=Blastococcus sp. TF02A-35 TaxID=2559612 RepID=UPI0010739829|nr:hypothetical protein [Blastococcus sp. TF02A_35]TFV51560.1 hypothetical protein E4P43_10370 [Blastococcus sp. TF02A_35]